MTEFIVAGLLPEIGRDLGVSLSSAGLLVSGYAAEVAVGAPLPDRPDRTGRPQDPAAGADGLFIVGNLAGALAPTYEVLMLSRVVAAFAHGTFFAVGGDRGHPGGRPGRGAGAIAMMFTGLTFANVAGVPAGTLIGQNLGWRATFWVITAVGIIGAVLHRRPGAPPAGHRAGQHPPRARRAAPAPGRSSRWR